MSLEKLLNKLIEKGWKPFGREPKKHGGIYCMETDMFEFGIKFYVDDLNGIWEFVAYEMPIRSVVSRESLLWQFVCENGMCKYVGGDRAKNYDEYANECDDCYSCDDYGYRLIESALCDEDKLEQFLISNIHIDE